MRHPQRWLRRGALALAVLAVAAAPAAFAQWPATPVEAPPQPTLGADAPRFEPCLADVPDALALDVLPGRLRASRSVFVETEREVELDKETALSAIALASALDERISVEDVASYRETRVEVCLFDRLSTLEGESVVGALALGADDASPALRALVVDAHVALRFELEVEQEVDLDTDTAFAAIAAHSAGIRVEFDDVVDRERSVRVHEVERVVTDLDERDTLLALALGATREGA